MNLPTHHKHVLKKIFKDDQRDRRSFMRRPYTKEDILLLVERDKERRLEVEKILNKNRKRLDGEDYYLASMVYQHGNRERDIEQAKHLAEKSLKLGYEKAKWLFAATTDRLLVRQGRKQKYGTQYFFKKGYYHWKLYPVNKRTTDERRRQFNVPSLAEQKKRVRTMSIPRM